MKILLLSLLLWGSIFANPYKNITYYTLDNGLEVYLLPDEKAKNVHIEVDVKVGMGAEDKQSAGISHLVEHIVFRDGRIKDSDYYNLIKEKGATYINGYTSYYKTQYVATINAENAYWISEIFAKMLFDKNVTEEDLRVEKGALQIEIGEPNWTDIFEYIAVGKFFEWIGDASPPSPDVYTDDFGMDIDADKVTYQKESVYKNNNKSFTLDEVMEHYHDYYFPANMTLKIAGKFELNKMKSSINKTFAKVKKRTGKTLEEPMIKDAKLDDKPYISYENAGMDDSSTVQLGIKMIDDDPKKRLIVESYMNHLADRLNKNFRNKEGETYSVSGGVWRVRNAAIASLYFNSPHDVFDKNIRIADEWMMRETTGDINDTTILDALKQTSNKYEAIEHDVSSLFSMIHEFQEHKKFYNDKSHKDAYTLLKQITLKDFRETLKEAFAPQHTYRVIQRGYVWFPYEGAVLIGILLLLTWYLLMRFYGAKVNKRKVKFHRRLSNIFTSVTIIFISIMISSLIYEWLVYMLVKFTPLKDLWTAYDIPLAYLIMIVDFALSILVLYFVVKKFFAWFYTNMVITESTLTLVGVKSKHILLKDISYCEVVPWSPSLWGKIYGVSLFFWRPLLKIVSKQNEELYIRSTNAQHLKEDLGEIIVPSPIVVRKF